MQRSYLRSLANSIPAIFQIGKNGLEPNSIRQFDEALEARELVKASVAQQPPDSPGGCGKACRGTGGGCHTGTGQPFVLYRESKKNKVIQLQ